MTHFCLSLHCKILLPSLFYWLIKLLTFSLPPSYEIVVQPNALTIQDRHTHMWTWHGCCNCSEIWLFLRFHCFFIFILFWEPQIQKALIPPCTTLSCFHGNNIALMTLTMAALYSHAWLQACKLRKKMSQNICPMKRPHLCCHKRFCLLLSQLIYAHWFE